MNSVEDKKILAAFERLYAYLGQNEYRGYEFDDYLSSRIVKGLCFGNLFLQRVAVQVGKLNPVNCRPLLGIPKLESTKARGFIAKGLMEMYAATGDTDFLDEAERHLDWLLNNYSTGYSGLAWGNAFDFASRGGFFPKNKPTIVWSAHISETLAMAYEVTRKDRYATAVQEVGTFILQDLERHENKDGHCFAYAPGLLNLVHNSNMLGAAALLRSWQISPGEILMETAKSSYNWSISHQNDDGSWFYGAEDKYRWIDNFHTAYNIDCLLTGFQIAGESVVPWRVIEHSYEYWVRKFFDDDGGPRYFHDRAYPYDIQCASQAIETLYRCKQYFDGADQLAAKVLHWTLERMQKKNGAFRFQLRPFWVNNQESLHWGQATVISALGTAYKEAMTDACAASDIGPRQ